MKASEQILGRINLKSVTKRAKNDIVLDPFHARLEILRVDFRPMAAVRGLPSAVIEDVSVDLGVGCMAPKSDRAGSVVNNEVDELTVFTRTCAVTGVDAVVSCDVGRLRARLSRHPFRVACKDLKTPEPGVVATDHQRDSRSGLDASVMTGPLSEDDGIRRCA
jgi:hypothetical protein